MVLPAPILLILLNQLQSLLTVEPSLAYPRALKAVSSVALPSQPRGQNSSLMPATTMPHTETLASNRVAMALLRSARLMDVKGAMASLRTY